LLATPLAHITLSFDGASKETFEHYRKGAKFEKVRDNFVRFAKMKHQSGSKMQVVVQMVRMPGNAHEVEDFKRFWSTVEGIDQIRVKEDETNLVQPEGRHARGASEMTSDARPCHYLWRGAMYVKQDGRGISVLPKLHARWRTGGRPPGVPARRNLHSDEMLRLRRLHAQGRAGEIDMCARCCTVVPHPVLVAPAALSSTENGCAARCP